MGFGVLFLIEVYLGKILQWDLNVFFHSFSISSLIVLLVFSRYFELYYDIHGVYNVFRHVNSPSHDQFWWIPWRLHLWSPTAVTIGYMTGGAIQMHGGHKAYDSFVVYIILLLNNVSAKTSNQKPPANNSLNISRHHGWDVQKQNV